MTDKNDFGKKELLKRLKDLETKVEKLEKGKSSKPKKRENLVLIICF